MEEMEEPDEKEQEEKASIWKVFKDLPAWYKVLFLLCFSVVSGLVFNLVSEQLLSTWFGFGIMDIDHKSISEENYGTYRVMMQFSSLFHQIGSYLLPVLTFVQLTEPLGLESMTIKRSLNPIGFVVLALLGFVCLFGGIQVQTWNEMLIDSMTSISNSLDAVSEQYQSWQAVILSGGVVSLIINIVLIGVLVPISEEFFFRAGIQRYFSEGTKRMWPAVLGTSVLFAILHFEYDGFMVRFGMSVLLGVLFWRSGSIWASVTLHAAYNTTGIIVEYLVHKDMLGFTEQMEKTIPAIALALTGILIFFVIKKPDLTASAERRK